MAQKNDSKSHTEHPFNSVNSVLEKFSNFKNSKIIIVVIVLIGLLALAFYKKEWFIAATVNGSPITNLELQMKLNKQFRTQILNQLINEKIILDEAAKNNIIVSDTEVNNKMSEIEANVGGAEALNTLLTQQGQTLDSVRQQIKLQLAIEKLYSNEATLSAEEVNKFIESNKEQLRASDSAGQIQEATNLLKQQKVSQIFSQKFQDLKTNAKIQTF